MPYFESTALCLRHRIHAILPSACRKYTVALQTTAFIHGQGRRRRGVGGGGGVLTPALLKTGRVFDSRMKWPKSGVFYFWVFFGYIGHPADDSTPPPTKKSVATPLFTATVANCQRFQDSRVFIGELSAINILILILILRVVLYSTFWRCLDSDSFSKQPDSTLDSGGATKIWVDLTLTQIVQQKKKWVNVTQAKNAPQKFVSTLLWLKIYDIILSQLDSGSDLQQNF